VRKLAIFELGIFIFFLVLTLTPLLLLFTIYISFKLKKLNMEKRTYKVDDVIHSSRQKRRRVNQKVDTLMESFGFSNELAQPRNDAGTGAETFGMNDDVEIDAIQRYLSDRENEVADPTIVEGHTNESAEPVRMEAMDEIVDDLASDFFCDTASEGRPDEDNEEEDDEDIFLDCIDHPEIAHTFKSALRELIVVDQIKECTADKLLNICELLPCYGELGLPKTCKTLLKTLRETPVRAVDNGFYYHFGLDRSVVEMLEKMGVNSLKNNELMLQFNIDGLPIAKSSNSQLWPILGMIRNVPGFIPFSVGIYHGYQKPNDIDEYLKEFVNELRHLLHEGIVYRGQVLKIASVTFVCDAPAKAAMTKIKSHNGFYSCSRCVVKGEWIDGRVVYLDEEAERRDDDSFRNSAQDQHHTGESSLKDLPGVDMVFDFILDYMHLVCLGVMKKLLLHWIRGPFQTRLGASKVQLISKRLLDLAEYFPREFARKPRSLSDIARWKATELRQFLLYTGPIVLKGILDDALYEHFMMLHVAIKILVNKDFCIKDNASAKSLLVSFVKNCKTLYGNTFIVYNVHNLIHLADDVLFHGVHLDMISSFPFENYLQRLLKLRRKHEKPLQQIVRRLDEFHKHTRVTLLASINHVLAKKSHLEGPLCTLRGEQFFELHVRGFVFNCKNKKDSYAYLNTFRVIEICNFVQTRNGYYVVGKEYVKASDLYKFPFASSDLDIYSLDQQSEFKYWPISSLKCKALVLPFNDLKQLAAFPINLQSHEKS